VKQQNQGFCLIEIVVNCTKQSQTNHNYYAIVTCEAKSNRL